MTRSGSDRSGSSPRIAASNTARDTPSCCAAGHCCASHRSNATSARAADGIRSANAKAMARLRKKLMVLRLVVARLPHALDQRNADSRQDKEAMDDRLPHDTGFGIDAV